MKLNEANRFNVEVRSDIAYLQRGGHTLKGDLYRPQGEKDVPLLVAFHGGGWKRGDRTLYQHLGPYLAQRGVALFAASYRLMKQEVPADRYPAAICDAKLAVKFVRKNALEFGIDPERVGLIGDSAGAHIAALVGLAGHRLPRCADEPEDLSKFSCRASVLVGIYGVYDMLAQWNHDQLARPRDHITEQFLGVSAAEDRLVYHEASPLTYVSSRENDLSVLLAWGTGDDVVDYKTQSEVFRDALKQAGYFVRTAILTDAPHFWISDPIDEAGSYTGFLAPRLFRFLIERL